MALGTDIAITLGVVTKLCSAKRPGRSWLFPANLPLGGDDYLNPLVVNLFKFFGIGIACVGAGYIALFTQYFVCLINLGCKLVYISSFAYAVCMGNEAVLFVNCNLCAIAGMRALPASSADSVFIGCVDRRPIYGL